MPIIDASNLTLNPEEARNLSEIIMERAYNDPELTDLCAIETGIQKSEQIVLAGHMGLVGKTSRGANPQTDTALISLTEKFWDPREVDFKLKHSKRDLPSLFKAFQRKMKATDSYNLEGSDELQFIENRAETAMMEANKRLAWFGRITIKNISEGGTLKNDIGKDYFNTINGLWEQIFRGVNNGEIKHVVITQNTEDDTIIQEILETNSALKILKDLYAAADSRLLDHPDAYFAITRSLYLNLQDMLEEKSLNFSVTDFQKSNGTLSYRGIPIKVAKFWDRYITEYFNDGTKKHLPHRAILSVKENLPVGTTDEGSMKDLNSWYNPDDRNNYIEGIWTIDAKVLEEYMIVAAY